MRVLGASGLLLVFALAACASPGLGAGDLPDTKPPAQLLRAETEGLVPGYMVESVGDPTDASRGCDAGDPEQKERSWRSSVEVVLRDNASVQSEAIVEQVVAAYVEDGWTSTPGDDGLTTVLDTDSLASTITLTRTDAETGGSITIVVDGPCVMTAGVDDPEVKKLDGRA